MRLRSGAFALEDSMDAARAGRFDGGARFYRQTQSTSSQIAERVRAAAHWLQQNAEAGRQGNALGTREWVVTNTPYLIVYRLHDDTVEILRVWHTKQNWKK